MNTELARLSDLQPPVYRIPPGHTFESAFFSALEHRLADIGLQRGLPLLEAFHASLVYANIVVLKKRRGVSEAKEDDRQLLQRVAPKLFDRVMGETETKPSFVSTTAPVVRLLALGAVQRHLDPLVVAERLALGIGRTAIVRLSTSSPTSLSAPESDLIRYLAFEVITLTAWVPLLKQAFAWLEEAWQQYQTLEHSMHAMHESHWLIPISIAYDASQLSRFGRAHRLGGMDDSVLVTEALMYREELSFAIEDQVFWSKVAARYALEALRGPRERQVKDLVVNTQLVLAAAEAPLDQYAIPVKYWPFIRAIQESWTKRMPGIDKHGLTLDDPTAKIPKKLRQQWQTFREQLTERFWSRLEHFMREPIPSDIRERYRKLLTGRIGILMKDLFGMDSGLYRRDDAQIVTAYFLEPATMSNKTSSKRGAQRDDPELEELRSPDLTSYQLGYALHDWVRRHRGDVNIEDLRYSRMKDVVDALSQQYHRLQEAFRTPQLEEEYLWLLKTVGRDPEAFDATRREAYIPFTPAVQRLIEAGASIDDRDVSRSANHDAYLLQVLRLLDATLPDEMVAAGFAESDVWLEKHAQPLAELLALEHTNTYTGGGEVYVGSWFEDLVARHPWIGLLTSNTAYRFPVALRRSLEVHAQSWREENDAALLAVSHATKASQPSTKPKKLSKASLARKSS